MLPLLYFLLLSCMTPLHQVCYKQPHSLIPQTTWHVVAEGGAYGSDQPGGNSFSYWFLAVAFTGAAALAAVAPNIVSICSIWQWSLLSRWSSTNKLHVAPAASPMGVRCVCTGRCALLHVVLPLLSWAVDVGWVVIA